MPYSNIDKPNSYFNTVTYAGTSATNNISVGFEPDFVWIKNRTDAFAPYLSDSVRGTYKILFTSGTNAEYNGTSNSDGVSAFTSTGFTLLNGTNADNYNKTANNYVAWNWRGSDSSAVSNTSGSITSTVSANTTSGFSVVSYTYTSGSVTVGHGLGVAPSMIIVKARSVADNWRVYHKSLGNSAFVPFTTAAQTTGSTAWNSTSPTSSVFSLGSFWSGTDTHIAYCFAEVKGFSKFGSYTGNGSTDGTFIYTGFKPAFFLMKRYDSTGDWQLEDKSRLGYNPNNNLLFPNVADAESSVADTDILSNGFKLRTTGTGRNASGGTYIYMAFAENPFVSSKGIPTTAR